jgi:hypothetical protein
MCCAVKTNDTTFKELFMLFCKQVGLTLTDSQKQGNVARIEILVLISNMIRLVHGACVGLYYLHAEFDVELLLKWLRPLLYVMFLMLLW